MPIQTIGDKKYSVLFTDRAFGASWGYSIAPKVHKAVSVLL